MQKTLLHIEAARLIAGTNGASRLKGMNAPGIEQRLRMRGATKAYRDHP
jgi:hypothetical protein